MRLAIFDNLANNAFIQARVLRRIGHEVDLVLDPLDRYAMSDPAWEELDIELPGSALGEPDLPAVVLPEWVRKTATPPPARRRDKYPVRIGAARSAHVAARRAAGAAGWRGGLMALDRAWAIKTLADYDCVIAYGMGPAWAALAGVPCLAQTWGGDITMLPFYDADDWEGHEALELPGPRPELNAQARLQRFGYAKARRLLLTDPRFFPYAERLGHLAKSEFVGFVVDTEKYAPGADADLRARLLGGREGIVIFVAARQDWYWKGSDRLLRGFAEAARERPAMWLVCAGWGADLERSKALIGELGIGDRVELLPFALSKTRLLRYYWAADIVADQFTVGSYGASALEAMSCGLPLLIALDRDRFAGRFPTPPPVMNVASPAEIGQALGALTDDAELRAHVGAEGRAWVKANHGEALAQRTLQMCEQVVREALAGR